MRSLRRIAVGYDASSWGRDALVLAELLARTAGADLLAVRVQRHADAEATARLEAELADALPPTPVRAGALALAGRSVGKSLTQMVERETEIGMLVIGSTHRAGRGRVMAGVVAERLLEGARCSIAVAPEGFAAEPRAPGAQPPAEKLRVIAVAFDGSAEAAGALTTATALALNADATLRVITAGPHGAGTPSEALEPVGRRSAAQLQQALHEAVAELPAELRALPIYEQGVAAQVVLERADEGVDLLIMGSRGYGPPDSVLVGSTSRAVIGAAPCPVVVVPRPAI
jgi:nucleotide-binding universal stress UspA family protein